MQRQRAADQILVYVVGGDMKVSQSFPSATHDLVILDPVPNSTLILE